MRIERVGPQDWPRFRAIRLRALADAPDAFGTTLAEDQARRPADWLARVANPDVATFLACSAGRDIGLAVGAPYVGREGAAGLFGMWVEPGARGSDVAAALVESVVSWARGAGYARVLLDVADDNAPAIRLYARMGFEPTGVTGSLPAPRDHILEHERALEL